MAQDKSTSPDAEERTAAIQLGRSSYKLSVAGIIVGIVCGVIVVIINIAGDGSSNKYHHSNY